MYAIIQTHLDPNKMANIFADDIFNCVFLNEFFLFYSNCTYIRFLSRATSQPMRDDGKSPFVQLTHWGLVTPNDDRDLGQIGSGNGLLPDGTKPLPEPMLTDHQ